MACFTDGNIPLSFLIRLREKTSCFSETIVDIESVAKEIIERVFSFQTTYTLQNVNTKKNLLLFWL